jgi:hypothetical protein
MPRDDKEGQSTLNRPTFHEEIGEDSQSNMFCEKEDLGNEASVESFFTDRLIKELGYEDSEIRTKDSIEALVIP